MNTPRTTGLPHSDDRDAIPPLNWLKILFSLAVMGLLAALAIIGLTGCKTALTSDKIVTIKQRVFGVMLETANTANSTPSIKAGLVTTVVHLVPTSTNGPIVAPLYTDSFDLSHAANPFTLAVSEDAFFGATPIVTPEVPQLTNDLGTNVGSTTLLPPMRQLRRAPRLKATP